MNKGYLSIPLFFLLSLILQVHSQSSPDNLSMQALKNSLHNPISLSWPDSVPCNNWRNVTCNSDDRVTHIQISKYSLEGSLPPELQNLSQLMVLEVANNRLTGPIPSLAGLSSLQRVFFDNNNFTSIPDDFFSRLTSLQHISLDYNSFSSWEIPESLKEAKSLLNFSANGANISGTIQDFLWNETFPGLTNLHLAMNNLRGEIPLSFSQSSIETLWLNDQTNKFSGSIAVLQNMPFLTQVWLHNNNFTGPLADLSGLSDLEDLSLRENQLTGIVPPSLVNLPKLTTVNLTKNYLQGPTPNFTNSKVHVDMVAGSNSFCLNGPGLSCDPRVDILLSIAESVGYPLTFADSWQGNNPCGNTKWKGITCDSAGNITRVDFQELGLSGTISSNFSMLTSLKRLNLSSNSLAGTIPNELTTLTSLETLDVSNNLLSGEVPIFRENVIVYTGGNPNMGKNNSINPPQATRPANNSRDQNNPTHWIRRHVLGILILAASCSFVVVLSICLCTRKHKLSRLMQSQKTLVINSSEEGEGNEDIKTIVSGWSASGSENGNMLNSVQVLRTATNNFSYENVLGIGGFETVYKGALQDRTKIAVKRMSSGVVSEKAMAEFRSEIKVLSKVRHRHLLALLGYCLDGNERLLVYEYMPQGTLSRRLFNWLEEGLKPMNWTTRLTIALDVARGVEYLHGLAHQSFIHRDLKPSNILLGDDMRAKVADFGLVRLVPEHGKNSIETRVAGTFGYLAPESVVTGRVTTKVDVFSFGVILMELITGRKAIDASRPEDMLHLITWFRSMRINRDTFSKAIDPTIELDEEILDSVITVSELADYCCASDPYQRPDMGHVVYVISSLVELWRPVERVSDDSNSIDLSNSLTSEFCSLLGTKHRQARNHSLLSDSSNTTVSNE